VSDGIIALSFLTIPIALLYIHKSRGESSPGETALIRSGARVALGSPAAEAGRKGVAPTEGAVPK
jgi:hypothetical protein